MSVSPYYLVLDSPLLFLPLFVLYILILFCGISQGKQRSVLTSILLYTTCVVVCGAATEVLTPGFAVGQGCQFWGKSTENISSCPVMSLLVNASICGTVQLPV